MYKILALNFHMTHYPPRTGGELRYFHFYRELSRFFDVTLLCPNEKQEKFDYSDTFREIRVADQSVHDQLYRLHRNAGVDYTGITYALAAHYPTELLHQFNALYAEADLIVHDHPYMLNFDLYFGLDNKPRVYNSYNYEAELARQLWTAPGTEKFVKYVKELEERLIRQADLVMAVSEEEKDSFIQVYQADGGKIILAPNGIVPGQWKPRKPYPNSGRPSAFFIGSKHPPNHNAVDFIVHTLADQCPEIDFIIAGDCCNPFQGIQKPNVQLLGIIDEAAKLHWFSQADIALNPMFLGTGTNLKTLEYLSAGIPLLSTATGARGLGLKAGFHYVEADAHTFAQKLKQLAGDPGLMNAIAVKGQAFVNKHYAWSRIAWKAGSRIEELLKGKAGKTRKTIVVLNDFPVSNPTAGGAERICRIGSRLSEQYRYILLGFSSTEAIERTRIAPEFTEILIPKTAEHLQEDGRMKSLYPIGTSDIVNSYMAPRNRLLAETAQNLFRLADAIVLSHPYMCGLLEGAQGKPVIYESLNCETELKRTLLNGHPHHTLLSHYVEVIEKYVCAKADLIVTVSDEDREALRALTGERADKFLTIPNGCRLAESNPLYRSSELKMLYSPAPVILFVGSLHPPNVEALRFINNELAPRLPDYLFLIIGSVCKELTDPRSPNVLLFHTVDESFKYALMDIADIAINPVIYGSGSNVKILDYFARKIPTISTPVGARGYPLVNGEHVLICGREKLQDYILFLVWNPDWRIKLSTNAYRLVSGELNWDVLAERYDRRIRLLLEGGDPHEAG
jgi:glycosyltransferase involved in cell wall biosynthesis